MLRRFSKQFAYGEFSNTKNSLGADICWSGKSGETRKTGKTGKAGKTGKTSGKQFKNIWQTPRQNRDMNTINYIYMIWSHLPI